MARSKQQVQALYDRLSGSYIWVADIWERRARQEGLSILNIQPGERVLEIGPGIGTDLIALARSAGSAGSVFAVDLSSGMIAAAKRRLQQAGLQKRIAYVRADAVHLPFQTGVFDAIYASFTLELFDTLEIPIVLSECFRVLRPAGRVCLVSLSKAGRTTWASRLYEWSHRRFPGLVDCRPIYARQAMLNAGFQIQRAAIHSLFGLPVEIILACPASAPSITSSIVSGVP